MYTEHFGLCSEPFGLTPDPAFLYAGRAHREALAALRIGLLGRRGLIVMVGEVGTGKTTLLYSLLPTVRDDVRIAYISNTNLSFEEILRQALSDFGASDEPADLCTLLTRFRDFLLRCAEEHVIAALVIDEAQNLDGDCLENLRLLSNVETFTHKLLQIVLVGQPELLAKLSRSDLRQLRERVAVYSEVKPLSWRESYAYVAHRLRQSGGSVELFSRPALALLLASARGIPRRINILCHNALLFAYGHDQRRVTLRVAYSALGTRLWRPYLLMRAGWRRTRGRSAARRTSADAAHPAEPRSAEVARGWRAVSWSSSYLIMAGFLLGLLLWGISRDDAVSSAQNPPAPAAIAKLPAAELPAPINESQPEAAEKPEAPPRQRLSPAQANERRRIARWADPKWQAVAAAGGGGIESAGDAPAGAAPPAAMTGERSQLVVVRKGANLSHLTREVYGRVDPVLLAQVRLANPQITNPNILAVGDILVFPTLASATRAEER